MTKARLVQGVGINDATYVVQPTVNGRRVWCLFYRAWADMLARCYHAKSHARYPTYIGCTVTPEWHSFMAFRSWMERQPWQGNHLDKDILMPGNKVYSPETCVFVPAKLNTFLNDRSGGRGDWPIGVSWEISCNKFKAQCSNPFNSRQEHIGLFTDPDKAHQAWRRRKHQLACQYADLQGDGRISAALRMRYATTTGAS